MQTFFITISDGNQDWPFKIEAHDIAEVSRAVDLIAAGMRMRGDGNFRGVPTVLDVATSKRRGVEYVDLREWVR